VLLETGCDGAGAAKAHRKCKNSRHGRPARAFRHGRDGHGAKSVASGAANHPAAGRGHSLASVIDAIEIKDEEKLGRPGNHLGTGRARSPVSVIDRTEIRDEGKLGRAALGPHCGRAMGMSCWRRCRASAVGDVARASCPVGHGRPARAGRSWPGRPWHKERGAREEPPPCARSRTVPRIGYRPDRD